MKSITMNMRWVVWLLLGIGVLFIAIGLSVGLLVDDFESPEERELFRYIFISTFGGIGIILAAIALFGESRIRKIKRLKERLISDGNFAWADIVDISANHYYAHYNARQTPCVLRCKLRHNDQTFICKSGYLRFNPQTLLPDGKVKVWFDAYDIKKYYVDVDGSMQNPVFEI